MAHRIWEEDTTVWASSDFHRRENASGSDASQAEAIRGRLGWLRVPDWSIQHLDEILEFAEGVRQEGFTHVVVLGMGGSSLCVEVLRDTFGTKAGYPQLLVLDSTHPDQILATELACDLAKTLFIVASKSGTTLEPQCYYDYFWERLSGITDDRSRHFAAITDPGTPLAKLASERRFRHTFQNPPDIGGRYSALSYFGMVPAALIGVDISEVLSLAASAASLSRAEDEVIPALLLGVFMGDGALHGRDKLTIVTDPEFSSFGAWAEQLIAESTGKMGKGILPVEGETARAREEGEPHRLYVHLTFGQEGVSADERSDPNHLELHRMEQAGLGAEFFRWEFATAVAGSILGINPFDEPNVAEAKAKTNEVLSNWDGKSPLVFPNLQQPDKQMLQAFLDKEVKEDGYIAIMAYVHRDPASNAALQALREQLSVRYHIPVTVGFGPRFLHSTGQLHKGGPPTGTFIQFVDTPHVDLPIPGKPYSFGTLIRAQAIGDAETLRKHNRPVICMDLGTDTIKSIQSL
ncbi:MAG: glucose-6-phosphate isomerase [Bacteroidota bacterium]|nr:glucose-6-phosphate isomerase [Bacteroidota bacterium]